MKMTTRPGEQFVVRRMAYSRIKKVFEENGIKFASPTVQVSGEGAAAAPAAAAARRTVERLAASEA
jgi:small-conductance mechanosensitive channel